MHLLPWRNPVFRGCGTCSHHSSVLGTTPCEPPNSQDSGARVGDLRRALRSAEKQGALRQTAAVGGYPDFTLTLITGESERARSLLPNFNRPGETPNARVRGACDSPRHGWPQGHFADTESRPGSARIHSPGASVHWLVKNLASLAVPVVLACKACQPCQLSARSAGLAACDGRGGCHPRDETEDCFENAMSMTRAA